MDYAADRELGDKMAQLLPSLPGATRANAFMLRSSMVQVEPVVGALAIYSGVMIVRTRWSVPHGPEELWPVLCDSAVELTPRCPVFYLGTPRPTECRLPNGPGEVGAVRQCVSEQGVVRQRITVWDPPARLAFYMEETDLCFNRFVDRLGDVFDLAPEGSGTQITRTTTVSVRTRFAAVLYPALWVGLKSVHRFVFRNWQRMRLA